MRKQTLAAVSRIALVLLAAASLAAFTDKAKRFSVEFPQGWTDPVADDKGNVQSNGPDQDNPSWCRANSNPLASLNGSSQAELNKTYAEPLDQPTWAGILSVDASKLKLIDHEARVVNGVVVQLATLSFTQDVLGLEAKGRFASYILPGRMVNVGCFSGTSTFPGMKASFDKVAASLKPL